jgi:hypothetical protein
VQAAVASEATYINVYIDPDDCIISFDGKLYLKQELDNIYSSLFVSQKDVSLERFRELAIGINSAQALNPKFIKVISGDGQNVTQLLLKPPNFEQIVEPEEILNGTKIHVKDRVSWRVASKFFKNITSQLPTEGQVIKDRCMYCSIPITINNEAVLRHTTMSSADVLCSINIEKDGVKGILGIPIAPYELSHLQFVKWGVLITTRHLRLSFIPVVGVIEANQLIKNVSQSDIVENDTFKSVLETIKSCLDDLIIELVNQYPKFEPSTEFAKKLRARDILLDVIESRFRVNAFNEESPAIIKKLTEVELFETTDKRFITLETLIEQFKKIGYLPFSRKYFKEPHPDNLEVLFLSDEKQVNFFDKIFAYRIKNVEQDFYQVFVRQKNMTEWESSRADKILLLSDAMVRNSFEDEGITCEAGLLSREPDNVSRVTFYIENGIISEKHFDIDGMFFDAVVNNNNLKTNYTWDDVVIDDELKRTLRTILLHLPAVYLELANKLTSLTPPDYSTFKIEKSQENRIFDITRLHIIRYMNFVLDSSAEQKGQQNPADEAPVKNTRKVNVKFTKTGREKGKGIESTEVFELTDINLSLTNDLKNLKLFKTVSGNLVSLTDLEKDIEQNLKIPYVTKEMIGPQLFEGLIIIASDKEEEVLRKYFGWYKVENYEKALADERSAMQHMSRPTEKPVLSEATIERVSFNIEGAIGEIGFLAQDVTLAPVQYGLQLGSKGGRMLHLPPYSMAFS